MSNCTCDNDCGCAAFVAFALAVVASTALMLWMCGERFVKNEARISALEHPTPIEEPK